MGKSQWEGEIFRNENLVKSFSIYRSTQINVFCEVEQSEKRVRKTQELNRIYRCFKRIDVMATKNFREHSDYKSVIRVLKSFVR